MSIYVISHASVSILENVLNEDTMKGCFSGGRLYAMGNANVLGTASAVHILVSIIGLAGTEKRHRAARIVFAISAFIGWFTLGLTGCRSGRIAVAVAVFMISFVILKEKMPVKRGSVMLSLLVSMLVAIAFLVSFFIPGVIYKETLHLIGGIFRIELSDELDAIYLHRIVDDDGTLTGRTDIWISGIKSGLKNVRRFFFGISPLGTEKIHGYTEGHHELRMPHAHNAYIEIFRKHGILGFLSLMALIIGWIVYCIKILFSKEKNAVNVGVVSLIAAVLLMGMVEPLPFISSYETFASLPFFMACGYCVKVGRTEH